MRAAILSAIGEWDKQWKAHSQVGSEDAGRDTFALLERFVESGELTRDQALSFIMAASQYITTGDREQLDHLLSELSDDHQADGTTPS